MWTGKYLINKRKRKHKAHLWDGEDTVCRMWSTGGLLRRTHSVSDDNDGRAICFMCEQNLKPKAITEIVNCRSETQHMKFDPAGRWLRQAIERDVREIANDKFFNTNESVNAEVDRRLDGIEHTKRVMQEMRARYPR